MNNLFTNEKNTPSKPRSKDYLGSNNISVLSSSSSSKGATSFKALSDVNLSGLTSGQFSYHNGEKWVNTSAINYTSSGINIPTLNADSLNLTQLNADSGLFSGDLDVYGTLSIRGEINQYNAIITNIDDAFIKLNNGNSEVDSGIQIQIDSAGTVSKLYRKAVDDKWYIDNKAILLDADVLNTLLTGYSAGTDTNITSTNNILTAFQNAQGQINNRTRYNANETITGSWTFGASVTMGTKSIKFNKHQFFSSDTSDDVLTLRRYGANHTLLNLMSPPQTSWGGAHETTIALVRGDNNQYFMDLYNMDYGSSDKGNYLDYGNPIMGLRLQKRGTGVYTPFNFEYSDGSNNLTIMQLLPNDTSGSTNNSSVLIQNKLDVLGSIRTDYLYNYNGSFISGFAGQGWKLSNYGTGWGLEVDKLTVRGSMNVYELIINQVRATNGSLWVSDSLKLVYQAAGSYYDFYFDDDNHKKGNPFRDGDVVQCQTFDGRNIKKLVGIVRLINGYPNNYVGLQRPLLEGEGLLTTGSEYDFVRISSVLDTNRQGAVYLTSSDQGSPYIDVVDGDYTTINAPRNIRYIKDWCNGSSASATNRWCEIQAINSNGVNVALNKAVTGSSTLDYPAYVVDGVVNGNSASISSGLAWVIVDLGSIMEVDTVKVWHYYVDGRTYYQTKTEVSADGVTWYPIHNYALHGTYAESSTGRSYKLGNQRTKARLGKLNGIVDSYFGALSGYGLYTQNAYLTGGINASFGIIGGWNINSTNLFKGGTVGSSTEGIELNPTNKYIGVNHNTNSYLKMYYDNSLQWGIVGIVNGKENVHIGSSNRINNCIFNDNGFVTPTFELDGEKMTQLATSSFTGLQFTAYDANSNKFTFGGYYLYGSSYMSMRSTNCEIKMYSTKTDGILIYGDVTFNNALKYSTYTYTVSSSSVTLPTNITGNIVSIYNSHNGTPTITLPDASETKASHLIISLHKDSTYSYINITGFLDNNTNSATLPMGKGEVLEVLNMGSYWLLLNYRT